MISLYIHPSNNYNLILLVLEIQTGYNASCRDLSLHYDMPTDEYVHIIHPWKDQRKLKVRCNGKVC